MASPPRTREEERRLNVRTLAIASAASATAAAVTSQLWIAGTWIAAAATPVIVALVSEMLHRPSERIARAITSDRPVLRLPDGKEPADLESGPPGGGPPEPPPPYRVYRQPTRHAPRRARRPAWDVVVVTAALALAIGAVALTATELIAGQSIGKADRATSLVGGKARNSRSSGSDQRAPTTPAPERTVTQEEPARTTREQPTETVTVPVPAETAPTTTTPAAPRTTP
jgi:hypothetical protein